MLQTKRLSLRNLCQSDAENLFAYRSDSRCNRYQRYDDTDQAQLEKFVRDYAHSTFLSKEVQQHYAIVRNDNSEMIGDISIFFTEADRCFTIGITIAPAYQRQGYAYELLREVIRKLQNLYSDMDIVALVEKENGPSIALFKKLGFVEECYANPIQSYVFVIYGRSDVGHP